LLVRSPPSRRAENFDNDSTSADRLRASRRVSGQGALDQPVVSPEREILA
jgi:hypothetical protein